MKTRLLLIDTATEACSCALWNQGEVSARYEVAGRSHTQLLMPMVQSLMSDSGLSFSQLDAFGCGIGPGSFAGVRIGTGYIKGLALALDRPVVKVNSLETMAQGQFKHGVNSLAIAIDARLEEIYWGAYTTDSDGLARALTAPGVIAPVQARWPGDPQWSAAGSGWKVYGKILTQNIGSEPESINVDALPNALDAVPLAMHRYQAGDYVDADALAPMYLRNKVALTHEEQIALRAARALND